MIPRFQVLVLFTTLLVAALAGVAQAGNGDCAQPLSDGSAPVASDCLYVLKAAVGSQSCARCVCDTNASSSTTASDALLCLRSAVGQQVALACAACCAQPVAVSADDIETLFLSGLDEDGNFSVPAQCAGNTPVCCTGGSPVDPCGPVHVSQLAASLQSLPQQDRVDLTLVMQLATVSGIPTQIPLVGNCLLNIDTTPGPAPTVSLQVQLQLEPGSATVQSVGSVTILDLTAADFSIDGSTACQLANFSAGFLTDQLGSYLAAQLGYFVGVCLGTDNSQP